MAVVNEGGGGEEEEASLSIAKCVHFTWSRRRRLRQLLVLFHEDTGQGRPTDLVKVRRVPMKSNPVAYE